MAAPCSFLDAALSLLALDGLLVLAVPNGAGFLADVRFPGLNMPPHHQNWRGPVVFRKLTEFLPVSVITIDEQPLTDGHVEWYLCDRVLRATDRFLEDQLTDCVDASPVGRLVTALVRFVYRPLLEYSGRLERVAGHTLYVELRSA